jgi:hypothetical protein
MPSRSRRFFCVSDEFIDEIPMGGDRNRGERSDLVGVGARSFDRSRDLLETQHLSANTNRACGAGLESCRPGHMLIT